MLVATTGSCWTEFRSHVVRLLNVACHWMTECVPMSIFSACCFKNLLFDGSRISSRTLRITMPNLFSRPQISLLSFGGQICCGRTLKVSSATCRSWWTSMMSGWAPCEKSLLKVRRTLLGVVASQSAFLSTQLRINSLVGVVLCCQAHVSQSTATYCNTLRKESATCFWYEATGWLIVPVFNDFQAAQKELNSLQMLIGQHDERLSTLQKESVQYQKDVPGSH